MERISILFAIVGIVIPALILGGVYSDTLNRFLCHRMPQLAFEGERLLFWGMLVLTAFVFGLIAMYLMLMP
jgi:hypothetical protein